MCMSVLSGADQTQEIQAILYFQENQTQEIQAILFIVLTENQFVVANFSNIFLTIRMLKNLSASATNINVPSQLCYIHYKAAILLSGNGIMIWK